MREPKSFPKESGQEQLNVRIPSFLAEEMKRFVYNPFTPVNSIREFVLDAVAYSLENWHGAELSPFAKRVMMLQQLERNRLDIDNEQKLYNDACSLFRSGDKTQVEVILPNLNDEHRSEVIRMLGGGDKHKTDLKVVRPDAISE
jgi:hypothetical protein